MSAVRRPKLVVFHYRDLLLYRALLEILKQKGAEVEVIEGGDGEDYIPGRLAEIGPDAVLIITLGNGEQFKPRLEEIFKEAPTARVLVVSESENVVRSYWSTSHELTEPDTLTNIVTSAVS